MGKFYQLHFIDEKTKAQRISCRARSGIESYRSLSFSCCLRIWKNVCSQNKDDCLFLHSPHFPHLPHCPTTEYFLRLFVEVNRTFSLLSNWLALTAVNCSERTMQSWVFFIYFRIKENKAKHQYALTEPWGLVSWAQVHRSEVHGFQVSARPLLLVNRGWVT